MAAPKGNQYNKKWKTVRALNRDINRYFKKCEEKDKPLTMTGLALALGTSRQTLLNYRKSGDKGFDSVLKRAKLRCHNFAEEYLFSKGGQIAGTIFNLKNNYGWKDKQEVEASGEIIIKVNKLGDQKKSKK